MAAWKGSYNPFLDDDVLELILHKLQQMDRPTYTDPHLNNPDLQGLKRVMLDPQVLDSAVEWAEQRSTAELLIKLGADPNNCSALFKAAVNNNVELVRAITTVQPTDLLYSMATRIATMNNNEAVLNTLQQTSTSVDC